MLRAPDGSVHISGEVVECDPPRKLTVTFNVNWPGLVEALGVELVRYEIEPAGDTVRLTMSQLHDRPISDDILSGGRAGLAGDPVEPEEPAGDRQGADHPDAAAGKEMLDALEGAGHQGAGRCGSHWPGEGVAGLQRAGGVDAVAGPVAV